MDLKLLKEDTINVKTQHKRNLKMPKTSSLFVEIFF